MKSLTGKLENWILVEDQGLTIVFGYIYGDQKRRFVNGVHMYTSPVHTPVSQIKEGNVIKTLNSQYLLGKKATEN
jgi:hypothetical protein